MLGFDTLEDVFYVGRSCGRPRLPPTFKLMLILVQHLAEPLPDCELSAVLSSILFQDFLAQCMSKRLGDCLGM